MTNHQDKELSGDLYENWVAYAKRGGLLDADGKATDSEKAQTSWYAWEACHKQSVASPQLPVAQMSGDVVHILRDAMTDAGVPTEFRAAIVGHFCNRFNASHPSNAVQDATEPSDQFKAGRIKGLVDALNEIDHWRGIEKRQGSINVWSVYVGGVIEGMVKDAMSDTPAATVPQVVQAPTTLLNAEELAALNRCIDCFNDGEGYDVDKKMMSRLAEIGVLRHVGRGVYETTEFGMHIRMLGINTAPQPVAASPSIVPSDEQIDAAMPMDIQRSAECHQVRWREFARKVLALTTASNAGEAKQGADK